MHAHSVSSRCLEDPPATVFFVVFIFQSILGIYAQAEDVTDFNELTIKELMERPVTSVSKTEQKFADTAAAIFVITQDDLRRSGVTNIPDALRMVPGVQVGQIDASKWAVTVRGFNGRFANKLLVLIDGRTVYTPTFSGVYWENQDLLLEDIERIEVIRGPGASVWGVNAVNGIINIITKHTDDTTGGLVSLTAGNEIKEIVGLRYGGQVGERGHYRVYGRYLKQDGVLDVEGHDAGDDWDMIRGGFRLDLAPSAGNIFMVQGDLYDSNLNQNYVIPEPTLPTGARRSLETGDGAGGDLLARWEYMHSLSSRLSSQFYYDRFRRKDALQNERRDTFDFEFQHELILSKWHELIWGLGYRLSSDKIKPADLNTISPGDQDLHLFSAFLQNKLSFFENRLDVTFGTKLQYYTFDGWQVQPNIRGLWKLDSHQRLWASVSRAIRTPSRGERGVTNKFLSIPSGNVSPLPALIVFEGNSDFD